MWQLSNPSFWVLKPYKLLIEDLYLIPRPIGFPEELQAGFNRGVITEAIDLDAEGEVVPAVFLNKLVEHSFQSDAVQGVVAHECFLAVMGWNSNGKHHALQPALLPIIPEHDPLRPLWMASPIKNFRT